MSPVPSLSGLMRARSVLPTSEAALYCGFKTPSALRKAHLERRVFPVGKRGGRGTWMWYRVVPERLSQLREVLG